MKIRLFTPGPTPIPAEVMLAMAQPIIHHRTSEFREILRRVEEKLRYVFQTKNDVYILASSGTGAMEAVVTNLFRQGDKALTIEAGKFGQRWGELCEAHKIPVTRHEVAWGKSIAPKEVGELLTKGTEFKAVFLTHSETSTGAAIALEAIAREIRAKSLALIVVDGITSVGAMPLKMDEWGVDAVVSGSQKGFMCPPGLAFVACSERATEAITNSDRPRFYFDLRKAKGALADDSTPFTPATTLISGLHLALAMISSEGIEAIWQRHKRIAAATRAAVRALDLQLLAEQPSDALTAVKIPHPLLQHDLKQLLKEKGMIVAGGQGHLKGKIIRISHLGYYDEQDLLAFFSALEDVLGDLDWPCQPGVAVAKFREVVAKWEKNWG